VPGPWAALIAIWTSYGFILALYAFQVIHLDPDEFWMILGGAVFFSLWNVLAPIWGKKE
jgi:hypothetical protein